jgi:hypothetical protein
MYENLLNTNCGFKLIYFGYIKNEYTAFIEKFYSESGDMNEYNKKEAVEIIT